jgi:hypothetical protein
MKKSHSIDSIYTNQQQQQQQQQMLQLATGSTSASQMQSTIKPLNGHTPLSIAELRDNKRIQQHSLSTNTLAASTPNGYQPHHHQQLRPQQQPIQSKASSKKQLTFDQVTASPPNTLGDNSFFDIVARIQSSRLDDQRCAIKSTLAPPPPAQPHTPSVSIGNKTRSSSRIIKSELIKDEISTSNKNAELFNDDLFNMIMRCQSSRLEDQRSSIAMPKHQSTQLTTTQQQQASDKSKKKPPASTSNNNCKQNGSTVPPDDAFFTLLQKLQSRRLDEQRSCKKPSMTSSSTCINDNHLFRKPHALVGNNASSLITSKYYDKTLPNYL